MKTPSLAVRSADESIRPTLLLVNLKYSPNLGDGVISSCIEHELARIGINVRNVDLAGRHSREDGDATRKVALSILAQLPPRAQALATRLMLHAKRLPTLRESLRRSLDGANGVILGGGNIFSDSNLNFPLKLNLVLTEAARAVCPVAILGIGVADNWSSEGGRLIRDGLQAADVASVSVRDSLSKSIWSRLVGTGPAHLTADSGILASEVWPVTKRAARPRPVIGVNVTSPLVLHHHADEPVLEPARMEAWFVELVAALTKRFEVTLFTNGASEDEHFLHVLAGKCGAAIPVAVAPRSMTPADLCRTIARFDAVVGHRLHANIIALSYERPSVGLTWDVKLKAFMADVGREAYVATPGRHSAPEVAALVERAVREGVDVKILERVRNDARAGIRDAARILSARTRRGGGVGIGPGSPDAERGALGIGRVVILNDGSDARGGASLIAVQEALRLRARGFPVTCIFGDTGEAEALRNAGVEVLSLGHRPLLQTAAIEGGFRGLFNQDAYRLVSDWMAKNDAPDVVYHLHNWSHILSPAIFSALSPVLERTVLIAHDLFLVCPNGAYVHYGTGVPCDVRPMSGACLVMQCDRRHYHHKLWRYARQAVREWLVPTDRIPTVTAIHPGQKPVLERGGVPPSAIRVLLNPVDPYCSERVPAEANRDLLFVGRLDLEKGADLAADAARRAGARLRIVGDGPMRADLERRFPEAIFCGRLTKAEIAEQARQSRALIVPSRYPEPFGLVAVEAMWSGLPVFLTATGYLAPEIEAAGAGCAINPRDVAGTAETLKKFLGDDALARTMSERAFSDTREMALTWSDWTDGLVAILEERIALSQRRASDPPEGIA